MLLAFDTSTAYVSVALHDGADLVVQLGSEHPQQHGEQLAPLIASVMDRAGIVRQDLTAMGVGVGPGPFTGLRVGLVTARTLSLALEIPVYGVCSLDGPVVARPADVATTAPVVGEGAVLYPDAFPGAVGPIRPDAGWLARVITEERAELRDPEPMYLRRPDVQTPGAPKPVS
jgi:tRNA threonylcarbamoyladenosine biosynthesis protein TsaB